MRKTHKIIYSTTIICMAMLLFSCTSLETRQRKQQERAEIKAHRELEKAFEEKRAKQGTQNKCRTCPSYDN